MNKNSNIKKTIGIATMVSSIVFELAAVISVIPIKKYRINYQKLMDGANEARDKIKKTKVRTAVLGSAAVTLAVIGWKFNAKKQKNMLVKIENNETDYEKADMINMDDNLNTDQNLNVNPNLNEDANPGEDIIDKPQTEEPAVSEEINVKGPKNDVEPKEVPKDWKCVECGHENKGEKKVCSYCGTLRSDILNKALQEW